MLAEDGTFQKPVISAGHAFWGLEVREEAGEAGGVGRLCPGCEACHPGLTVQPLHSWKHAAHLKFPLCSGVRNCRGQAVREMSQGLNTETV